MISSQKDSPQAWGWQGPVVNPLSICYPLVRDTEGLLFPVPTLDDPVELRHPVRKIKSRYSSFTGAVPFKYLGKMVRHESLLESELLHILKVSDRQFGIVEQPFTLDMKALGFGRGKYTPDFLIFQLDGSLTISEVTIVEVKPENFIADPSRRSKYRRKFKAAMRFCRRQGWRFRICTERHLRREPKPIGEWPYIHFEAYRLAPPIELVRRLFIERAIL